jgi:hypothetical protein
LISATICRRECVRVASTQALMTKPMRKNRRFRPSMKFEKSTTWGVENWSSSIRSFEWVEERPGRGIAANIADLRRN